MKRINWNLMKKTHSIYFVHNYRHDLRNIEGYFITIPKHTSRERNGSSQVLHRLQELLFLRPSQGMFSSYSVLLSIRWEKTFYWDKILVRILLLAKIGFRGDKLLWARNILSRFSAFFLRILTVFLYSFINVSQVTLKLRFRGYLIGKKIACLKKSRPNF